MNQILKSIVDRIQSEKSAESKKVYNILFLGDSTTSAEWVHPNWRDIMEYVIKDNLESQLSDWKGPYFTLRFLNAGLNGGDTREFIDRAQIDMVNFEPDLIIMIGGDNDNPDIQIPEHVENITILKHMMSSTAPYFVYCTAPYTLSDSYNKSYREYVDHILQIPVMPNEIFINLFQEYQQFDISRFFTYKISEEFEAEVFGVKVGDIDYLHPNMLGQAYIAKILLDKVFGISFNPEFYIEDVKAGLKYQRYE